MKALKRTLAAAILIVSSTVFAAASNNVTVSHFEPLQRLSIHTASNSSVAAGHKSQQTTAAVLSFDAMGRSFDLQLEPNDRLLSGSSRDALTSGVEIYRGQLANNPDSWARIVVYDGVPRGIIWDGIEMFAIEAPGDSLMRTTTPVIYRLADVIIDPGSMTCGVESSPTNAMGTYNKLVRELAAATTTTVAQGPGAVKEITVYAIGDYEFTTDMGGSVPAEMAIMTRLNNVDGYFSQQVGVQIRVPPTSIETHTDPVDPFTESDPGDLLDELSAYRDGSLTQEMHGLTHLYTGRNFSSSTAGIAWVGGICDDNVGAGLSQGGSASGPTIDSLVAAHEIGHNFNADHDGAPAPRSCPLEPEDFIMAPSVNANNDTFSDCSVGVMQAWAAAPSSSCVTALPTVDMSISLNGQSATVLLGANTVLSYDINQNGTDPATNVTADFTLPVTLSLDSVTTSMGTCIPGAGGVVNCVLGDVAGLSSNTIDIITTPTSVGPGLLSATVDSDMNPDERPGNNQVDLQLTVNPAVDLVVNTPTAPTIIIDESTTISAALENRSILPSIGATLTITLSNGLQIDSVSWPIGTCMITTQQIDCVAANFDALSSSTLSIGVTGIATGSKSYTVALSSAEAEANPGDNNVSGTLRVNSPKDSGGAMGPMFLWLLAMFTALGRGRLHQRKSGLPR